MMVNILHKSKKFSGKVVYNFNVASDIILIQFDHLEDIGSDVLLYWDDYTKKWCAGADIENRFPEVFGQLLDQLKNVLNDRLNFIEKRQIKSFKHH